MQSLSFCHLSDLHKAKICINSADNLYFVYQGMIRPRFETLLVQRNHKQLPVETIVGGRRGQFFHERSKRLCFASRKEVFGGLLDSCCSIHFSYQRSPGPGYQVAGTHSSQDAGFVIGKGEVVMYDNKLLRGLLYPGFEKYKSAHVMITFYFYLAFFSTFATASKNLVQSVCPYLCESDPKYWSL